MPTLPLHNPEALDNAWHQVRAPGGYECWRFEVHEASVDRQMIAELWYGDVLNSTYINQFFRFMNRPTRAHPTLPQQFICTRVLVIEHGTIQSKREELCPADRFAAQIDR